MSPVLGAKVAPVNSCLARDTCPCSTRLCAAFPRRCCSVATSCDVSPLLGPDFLSVASLRSVLHSPLENLPTLKPKSSLPTEPPPLGLLSNIMGTSANAFQALSSATLSPTVFAGYLSRRVTAKHSRKRPRNSSALGLASPKSPPNPLGPTVPMFLQAMWLARQLVRAFCEPPLEVGWGPTQFHRDHHVHGFEKSA